MKLFAIYDSKAKAYMNIVQEEHHVNAIRQFDRVVNESNSQLALYPDDFELHELADFDKITGDITPSKKCHALARNVLRNSSPKEMHSEDKQFSPRN